MAANDQTTHFVRTNECISGSNLSAPTTKQVLLPLQQLPYIHELQHVSSTNSIRIGHKPMLAEEGDKGDTSNEEEEGAEAPECTVVVEEVMVADVAIETTIIKAKEHLSNLNPQFTNMLHWQHSHP